MIFKELKLKGAYLIELNRFGDKRGFFTRTFCAREFSKLGLEENFVQSNWSFSESKDTLRGLHFQTGDAAESKLVRCTRGRLIDVIVDIRKDSTTYLQHHSEELSHENGKMLYVPRGFAHGFITLEDRSEIFYQVSNYYNKEMEAGIRWDDPKLNIQWPVKEPIVSDKDLSHNFL
ncbi:dTDP-4-dehydrorhamnose 3,5-epimerase [Saprospiraceae bacterium]|nr:dTDP-4-dehydrorhamnose 3,5-epimerase [Saprospiraceae bacterium]